MLRSPLRPDARLVQLHAEGGDPQARLAQALADLEEADWGLLLHDEAALAQQVAALVGPGVLRVDGRLPLSRGAWAEAGLAIADLHGDFGGTRAVWLLEPDEWLLRRTERAGAVLMVDGTLAPGGGWPGHGAALVCYRDAVTLSGHRDLPLSLLFGNGAAPERCAPPPSDLSVAQVLRDVASLPLRLARAARTTTQLLERLGPLAQRVGPTALLLPPDLAADTAQPPGGVLAALRHVPDGLLLTPGLEDAEAVLRLLPADLELADPDLTVPEAPAVEVKPSDARPRREERPKPRLAPIRFPEPTKAEGRSEVRADKPSPAQVELERFTFEAPQSSTPEELTTPDTPWEPEIVFSDLDHPPVPLTHTVSNGPDGAEPSPGLNLVVAEEPQAAPDDDASASKRSPVPENPATPEASAPLAPDLPRDKDDPALDLNEGQAAIYARLREWRNAEAKRQEISRFIIASNATLAEIARRIPYTPEDLRAIKGMGPGRLEKYGSKILEVVRG